MSELPSMGQTTAIAGKRVKQGATSTGSQPVWRLLGAMCAIWMGLSLYANKFVLSPQVLEHLTVRAGGMVLTPDQVEDLQHLELLSYGLLPVLLTLRVASTALVLQLITMLSNAEFSYRRLFRASLWGFTVVLYGVFGQTLRLDLLGADLTMWGLSVVPDSLAALIMSPPHAASIGYAALSLLNLHGLLWIGILFAYFRLECRIVPSTALLIPLCAWAIISCAQLGLQAFTAQILG
jgi:hypothetical protein